MKKPKPPTEAAMLASVTKIAMSLASIVEGIADDLPLTAADRRRMGRTARAARRVLRSLPTRRA